MVLLKFKLKKSTYIQKQKIKARNINNLSFSVVAHPPLLTQRYLTIIAKIITTAAINTYFNGTVSSYGIGFSSSLAVFSAGFADAS